MTNHTHNETSFFTTREAAQVARARGLELLEAEAGKIEIREKGRVLARLATLTAACAFLHMPGILTH